MPYPFIPTVFLMNIASNGASNITDTQSNLQQFLQVFLNGGTNPDGYVYEGFFPEMNAQLYGGDWSVKWGPCVYCSAGTTTPTSATNAMYVAYSQSLDTYVVAIAATNPLSAFDWIAEDGTVDPHYAASWPPTLPFAIAKQKNPPSTAAISAATALGISDLLTQPTMIDPAGGDLATFLNANKSSSSTLIFTGHSLAGALSPTLAFYLNQNPANSGWKQVLVLPTAGATPGNQQFADAWIAAFPQQADSTSSFFWNTDNVNQFDVVPHAWNVLQEVAQAPAGGFYQSIWGVMADPAGGTVYDALQGAIALSNGYYQPITQQWFEPSFGYWNWPQLMPGTSGYPPAWASLPNYTSTSPLSSMTEFGQIIIATHIDQYSNIFGIMPPPKMQHAGSENAGAAAKSKKR
jgi:hypothetical protein